MANTWLNQNSKRIIKKLREFKNKINIFPPSFSLETLRNNITEVDENRRAKAGKQVLLQREPVIPKRKKQ
jgi:hypothetical protein